MENKTSIEAVAELLPQLSAQQQREVQDFVEFLLQKTALKIEGEQALNGPDWTSFSLSNALRGMGDEGTLYSEDDLQDWS